MNPWAFIVIAIGVIVIVIGVKGTQHNITAAIVGHPTGSSGGSTSVSSGTNPIANLFDRGLISGLVSAT